MVDVSAPSTGRRSAPVRAATHSLRHHARSLALAALLVTVACGDSQSQDRSAPARDEARPAQAGSAAADGPADDRAPVSVDELELTVGGGPYAGTHRFRGDLNCFGLHGDWGASMERQSADSLSAVNILLADVPPSGGRSERGSLQLVFGDAESMSAPVDIFMLSSPDLGGMGISGAAERQGRGGTFRVGGTRPEDGATVSAVIRCATLQ